MEVGAVKQAFNNEVIQLKKNLNQAKIQVIHKLTRKAKTLAEKKCPEHLKEKNKKKAESAVREVLIMKKLKPRDIAAFIITYKGDLDSQLNKPIVDSDKACARLLLNKSLQQKYISIKDKFGDIPIKDLLMSRQERRKLKKEAKDAQKNKKKGKDKVVNSAGDWNVEDVKMGDDSKEIEENDATKTVREESGDEEHQDDDDVSGNESHDDENDDGVNIGDSVDISDDDDDDDSPVTRQVVNGSDESSDEQSIANDELEATDKFSNENIEKENSDGERRNNDDEIKTRNIAKLKSDKPTNLKSKNITKPIQPTTNSIEEVLSKLKQKNKPDKKVKDNKNKNLNEKMLNRKFKRDTDDNQNAVKVVDPFFKTATGGSYMSVAEPRQPDEVKEVHRQGNRQERRAVMFGRAPMRPRRNRTDFRSDKYNRNDISNHANGNDRNSFDDRKSNDSGNSKFNRNSNINNNSSKFNNKHSNFNNRNSNFNDKSSNFNDKSFNNKISESKEEKLHPSWEAKKKQSGILPFKGKKTVFDDN